MDAAATRSPSGAWGRMRTIPWGVRRAVEAIGGAPDVVYDEGDIGKEPMIFLFGRTPQEVANRVIRIATEYAERRKQV